MNYMFDDGYEDDLMMNIHI